MERIREWYRSRTDATKAALRTAGQTVVGVTGVFVLAVISEGTDVLNGQPVQEAAADLSVAGKAWGIGILGAAAGLVSYIRNRYVAGERARYGD